MKPFDRPVRTATVLTHGRPDQSAAMLAVLRRIAEETGTELWFDADETAKHGLDAGPGRRVNDAGEGEPDLCVALGGDGTILRGLRQQAGTGVPVFAINLGEIGFLSTVEPGHAEVGIRQAFCGDFEVLDLPALTVRTSDGPGYAAINDVSVQRRSGDRVADLRYRIDGEEVGHVRCDGLVVATPAGSTGYNLANGGPVLAWGVEGYAVSFIAPHTLSARALVVAPDDELELHNGSSTPVELSVDGRPQGVVPPDGMLVVSFQREAAVLAQTAGATFYRRLREKFGRLAG